VYTGPLLQKKDGILTIIKSFSNIANEFPDTNLVCTGSLDHSVDRDRVKNEIESSKAKDRIILKGFISRSEMIELLNSAACLVLAKPSSDQADTCFPTKLGEYLATGNPIVVTSTGEIPLYLKDGENAYIAEPDSVGSFTQKLRNLLSDSEMAQKIGLKGRQVAEEKFNYKEIAKKVTRLIEDIKKKGQDENRSYN
ncbi:MAG: glycosyltransferase, partial [Candidatus Delongbacteria bacterium]|nr:glycosyltransferase [Candidatus Delongbacteria bacterium]